MLDLDAGLAAEIFGDQMAVAANPGGRIGQRLVARLAVRDEVLEAPHIAGGPYQEGDRSAGKIRHVGEIVEWIVADLRIGDRCKGQQRQGGDDEVIAVRLRMGDELDPDRAASASASLDEE